jgi:hypothetical protein
MEATTSDPGVAEEVGQTVGVRITKNTQHAVLTNVGRGSAGREFGTGLVVTSVKHIKQGARSAR